MPYQPRDTKTLLQSMAARVIARTELTDLSEGSVLLQVLSAIAEEIGLSELRLQNIRDSFFLRDTVGTDLDERAAEMPPSGLTRRGPLHAQGAVLTVTREDETGGGGGDKWANAFVLPAGSTFRRSDDASRVYETVQDVLFDGSPGPGTNGVGTVDNVYVKAQLSGEGGNCLPNAITVIDSAPSQIIAVTNSVSLQNGSTRETDESLRNRIVAYLSSLARCQPTALEYVALSFVDQNGARATFANLFEDPADRGYSELVIDDGSGLSGNVALGAKSTGIVPQHGQAVLYHTMPATRPIQSITVNRLGIETVYKYNDSDYISIHERGLVYFPEGVLQPGDEWTIDNYEVYTNLVANLQRTVEGSTSDPVNLPGWRAAGTRVVVKPADIQLLALDIHVIPQQYIALSEVADELRQATIDFMKRLAPGETFYVSQLIDTLMNNSKIISLRIYEPGSGLFKEDDPTPNYRTAWRTNASVIQIIPSQEDS